MTGAEIWGSVVPAWLSGVGGLAAAVVGTIALVKSVKTQGGVETLKGAANAEAAPESSATPLSAACEEGSVSPSSPPVRSPVSWTAWHNAKNRYRLRNDSVYNGATARLTGFEDVTPGGDRAAAYHGPIPVELAAGESVPFTIDKSLASPSVTAVKLTWEDEDGTQRERTLYI